MTTIKIGEDEKYEFDFGNPGNREVMQIERVFDGTFKDWGTAVRDGSITALTCLVYVLRKRDNPGVRFDDVEFNVGDFDIEDPELEEPADGAGEDVVADPQAGEPAEPTAVRRP
jgi:hypothetical protein